MACTKRSRKAMGACWSGYTTENRKLSSKLCPTAGCNVVSTHRMKGTGGRQLLVGCRAGQGSSAGLGRPAACRLGPHEHGIRDLREEIMWSLWQAPVGD